MAEPKELDDGAKLAIEEELSRIESAAYDILVKRGIDWNEELSRCATTFREVAKIFPELPDIQLMPHAGVFPMYFAIGFCRARLRHVDDFPDGDSYSETIGLLCVASRALGCLTAWHALSEQASSALVQDALGKVRVRSSQKALESRHETNRAKAERIKYWWIETGRRKHKSMDAAAEAAARIESVSFRTARKHIAAAAKELRSARTA